MFKKSLLAIVAATALFGANVSMASNDPAEARCNNDGNYIAYVIHRDTLCTILPVTTLPVTTLQHQ